MKKCFLFHDWEKINIKEDVKIIGNEYGQYETGIFIRRFETTTFYKCRKCNSEKNDISVKEETNRQYH